MSDSTTYQCVKAFTELALLRETINIILLYLDVKLKPANFRTLR